MNDDWTNLKSLEFELNQKIRNSNSSIKSISQLEEEISVLSVRAKNNSGQKKKLWILIDEFNTSCH